MSEQPKPSLAGQLDAFIRQGAKDLHNAIVPAFPQAVHGGDEPGTPLNPTAQMVTQDLEVNNGYGEMLKSYASRPVSPTPPDKQQEIER